MCIAPSRRRERVLPLPDWSLDSDDMQEEGHTPSPEARSTGRQQSLPQRLSTPHRRPHDTGTQHADVGEGPSFFGGLEASMLKVQRLQNKNMRAMHRQMQAHNANMGGLHKQFECLNTNICKLHEGQLTAAENTRELTNAMKELCTEIRHERVRHRRHEMRFMGMFSGICRSVNHLATSTALISRRAVATQVEAAHSSCDVAQGLVQITNVLDTMLANRNATLSELGVGDTEESSSPSSLAVPMMDPRCRSARHSTATEPDTGGAGEATAHSSGMHGTSHVELQ
ncbi:hypothetical protein NDU88_010257 [Pleurodeles waltl]|uniref:Uncharacterized protein n=1 Tax=Pleurodeles waltl TaxID=8319 RepID=A0AAV7PXS4_PLEWA|nr:hypothetical protein NDU88_010257 [Pleurodeles waltl]